MEQITNEILYPTLAIQEGYLNRRTIKDDIPTQILKGLRMCRENGMQCIPGEDTKIPNCANTKWTTKNIATKDIRTALTKEKVLTQDLEHVRQKST